MKSILVSIVAAVVLVGCGPSVDIWTAANKGNIEAVKQHIAAGTDLDAKMQGGHTPLHTAANSGHKEVVELLIDNGADVNAKTDVGTTPLFYAAADGQKEIAELLIVKGADVNAKGREVLKSTTERTVSSTVTNMRGYCLKSEGQNGGFSANPFANLHFPQQKVVEAGGHK